MIRHVETSNTSKTKDRLLNVKGKEMGISGEYRLEYMPLMIQNKNQVEFRIYLLLFFILCMFCTCILQCPGLGTCLYTQCVEKFIFYPDRFHFPLFLLFLIPVQIINLPIC